MARRADCFGFICLCFQTAVSEISASASIYWGWTEFCLWCSWYYINNKHSTATSLTRKGVTVSPENSTFEMFNSFYRIVLSMMLLWSLELWVFIALSGRLPRNNSVNHYLSLVEAKASDRYFKTYGQIKPLSACSADTKDKRAESTGRQKSNQEPHW